MIQRQRPNDSRWHDDSRWHGLLCEWIDIPSVTGDEAAFGHAVSEYLEGQAYPVEHQELEPRRFNVAANLDSASVVLCTHLDTVPGWFPARDVDDAIYGRGACDAKGQIIAMLAAAERLRTLGEDRVGFLFTVGEETDSLGARSALPLLKSGRRRPGYIVLGEPTENRFVRRHKGLLDATLLAKAKAGHSSQEGAPSAVHTMIDALHDLLDETWPHDEELGATTLNVGCLEGGVAPNVHAVEARARIFMRLTHSYEGILARLERLLGDRLTFEGHPRGYGPVSFAVPKGLESTVVSFATDAHHLRGWGTPLLYGPGSIDDAHTEGEKISKASLARAIDDLTHAVTSLLTELDAEKPFSPDTLSEETCG